MEVLVHPSLCVWTVSLKTQDMTEAGGLESCGSWWGWGRCLISVRNVFDLHDLPPPQPKNEQMKFPSCFTVLDFGSDLPLTNLFTDPVHLPPCNPLVSSSTKWC